MKHHFHSVSNLPNKPAVYALFGGKTLAYIGVADKLKQRISQHLIKRDSSITTGTSIVSLNPEYVTQVAWWEHPDFSDRTKLEAAELVAFEILDPILRSRGSIREAARSLLGESLFKSEMVVLFSGEPTGLLEMPTYEATLVRIDALEGRLAILEAELRTRQGKRLPTNTAHE